ncbi:Retrotransposon-derived protein PEG10 [Smittium culicis]|uniref:Retrotransposon-derived protein PEG10 n=1 Tax=Smittium culicis TaxID=133412 RepID=A0A1R1XZ71_9FUNG|nr:Retrotransposon-derived protein PEG10 [Smittium culicis]
MNPEEKINLLLDEIQKLKDENERLSAMQASVPPALIPAQVLPPVSPPVPVHLPQARFALSERYDGNRSLFRGFVNQCRLLFFTNPDQYPTDVSKVGLVMSLLSGNAVRWASPYIEKESPLLYSFELFLKELCKVFDDPQRTETANDSIRALRIGPNPVSMYSFEFRILMMDLDWNESALVSQFSEGLNENVLDTLALFQTPTDLEGYINAAITVDSRLTRRKEEKARKRRGIQPLDTSRPQLPEPMHVDAIHRTVSQSERERRMKI